MEHLRNGCDFGMIEEPVEAEGYGEEEYAYADKLRHHGAREDGGFAAAGLLVHDATRWRQRGKGHCSEGIHDEVHPQHLGNGEWRFRTHERAEEYKEAGGHIDRELEQKETLDILVERATPHHGTTDG